MAQYPTGPYLTDHAGDDDRHGEAASVGGRTRRTSTMTGDPDLLLSASSVRTRPAALRLLPRVCRGQQQVARGVAPRGRYDDLYSNSPNIASLGMRPQRCPAR